MDDLLSSAFGTRTEPGPASPIAASPSRAPKDRRKAASVSPLSSSSRESDEKTFLELRRKVQSGELVSASTERLLWKMKFNGHLTVVVQHGRVVKSGYEEGYYRRKNDLGGLLSDS